ncbi:hypothetical protein B0T25DRAFT_614087 [Lasiosphaeria hispida]|uniref:Zn(2)-C6 fungal-type domain-containing protein n=1 Tax=Lasiosphaeria hispida TaxID=260671 RepID=A0AAJ0HCQ1_9PEZI|nr:hypothetical protein B0T25DRAFT_614087 [Lasiosphaeria hispida]
MLYFCSICGKPFDQEISHTRHVQYCRRRAAQTQTQPGRPKACQSCRKTKSKCDFGRPCSRCVGKQLTCTYASDNAAAAEGGEGASTSPDAAVNPDLAAGTSYPSLEAALGMAPDDNGGPSNEADDLSMGGDFLTEEALTGDNWQHAGWASRTPPNLRSSNTTFRFFDIPSTFPQSSPYDLNDFGAFSAPSEPLDMQLLLAPNRIANAMPKWPSASREFISPGCRAHIVSIIRTYPRMMMRPESLPPFIHPAASGLHISGRQQPLHIGEQAGGFTLLKPISVCFSIAHIFTSRTVMTEGFLWQRIDDEHHRIQESMDTLTRDETLASIQTMVIYLLMRLIESGHEYFLANRDMLKTMKKLSARFAHLAPGPFSPAHSRMARPTWRDWIHEETRRRVTIVCFLTSLVVGAEGCDIIMDPNLIPLPSGRALWEARTEADWEREFEAAWAEFRVNGPRLDTVGDLAVAKFGAGGAVMGFKGGLGDGRNRAVGDVLDGWHAGLDGLGMMLAAVMAGV